VSLFGSLLNLGSSYFGGPPVGTFYDVLDAADGGGGGAGNRIAPRKGVESVQYAPTFTGIGASTLDEYGNFDMGYGETGVFSADVPVEFSSTGFEFTPPSISNQVLSQILGAIIPSAEAAVTRTTGASTMGSIVGAAASVLGGAAAVGATAAGMFGRMSQTAATAIFTLRNRLTGLSGAVSAGALAAYGRKTYAQIAGWVRANPGTSAITLLTGLGLTVEQAAHFMAWGATSKRRTRSKGISGRDIKNASRTIRKMAAFNHRIQRFCGMIPHRAHHHRRK